MTFQKLLPSGPLNLYKIFNIASLHKPSIATNLVTRLLRISSPPHLFVRCVLLCPFAYTVSWHHMLFCLCPPPKLAFSHASSMAFFFFFLQVASSPNPTGVLIIHCTCCKFSWIIAIILYLYYY